MEIVRVIWQDAGLESMQLSHEEAVTIHPMLRENVGYVARDDSESIILVFGIINDRDKHATVYDQTLVIPQGMVVEKIPLEPHDKP